MRNATHDPSATRTDQQDGVMPHRLIVIADSVHADVSLIAPTEGAMRFIAGSPAITSAPQRGIPDALARLAAQCGYALTAEMLNAAVVGGPPIMVQVVSESGGSGAEALEAAERYGVARIAAEPITPPRNPARHRLWFQPIIEARRNGRIDALLIIVPPGALPHWAAQLLNALSTTERDEAAHCLVLAPNADLAAALPPGTIFIPADDHRSSRLTTTLNHLRAARMLPAIAGDLPLLARPEALGTAMRALSAHSGKPCVYLDVAEGTTIVVAHESKMAVHHDPAFDYARGAIRLLHHCGAEEVARWIPFACDRNALRTWAARRASWPMALLTDQADRAIAAAFARASLRRALETIAGQIPAGAMWLLGPAISGLGSQAAALGIVADLLPSAGVAVVACDADDLIPVIGAMTLLYPADVAGLLACDFVPAGSVVRAFVAGERAHRVLSATLTEEDGRTKTAEIAANACTIIACQGAATLSLSRDGEQLAVHGGAGGILVDRRRRPLAALPNTPRPNVSGRLRPADAMDTAARGTHHQEVSRVP